MRICAVSYLNTKPFLYGLECLYPDAELILQIPSLCVENFKNRHSDLALVPVGSLLDFQEVNVLSDFCIGANGKVDSVFLFSQRPLAELKKLYLDAHSRTSNGLVKVLAKFHWVQSFEFCMPPPNVDSYHFIEGEAGAVVIGDRAIQLKNRFLYTYDLAYEWKIWTGLPFVFAVWVFDFTPSVLQQLPEIKKAFQFGLQNLEQVATIWSNAFGVDKQTILHYYHHNLSYELDADKKEAIRMFLQYLATIEEIPIPTLRFF